MCLQVPGKVVKISGKKVTVDYDIEKRTAMIVDITPKINDYVLVVGKFVVDIVPEDNAKEALEHWKKTMQSS
jgi:hydrogenase assembly chaperone HypC/HupF